MQTTIPAVEIIVDGVDGPEKALAPKMEFPANALKIECDGQNYFVTVPDVAQDEAAIEAVPLPSTE